MSEIVHISSIVVRARPEMTAAIAERIEALACAEVAVADPSGRIVVTLETPDEGEIVQALTDIQLFEGVVSAALVFHQTDAAPEDAAAPTPTPGARP